MPSPNPLPANVRQLHGRHEGVDSGGRKIPEVPAFKREAPEKPETLSPIASELWDRLIPTLSRLDLLKAEDGEALAVTCEAYSRWRDAVEMRQRQGITTVGSMGSEIVAPWVRVEETAGKQYIQFCHEFGLTPSAEMRLAKEAGSNEGKGNNADTWGG